ncbi:MAG: VTT domain-containing protein [Roseibacillus sp.]
MEWLEQLQNYHGPPLVLALLICLGTLISEDLACIAAGILAAKGWIPFPLALAGASLGIYGGDLALYGIGHFSQKSKRHWRWLDRLVSEERIERGRRLFERYGTRWIFLSRFLPGSRLPSYIAAGAVGWSFPRFTGALGIAVLIWTPVLVGFSFYSGQKVLTFLEGYQKWAYPILWILALVLFLLIKIIVPLFSWRGRRLLAGKWRRLTHWEYWPPAIVYPFAIGPLLFRRFQGGRTLDFLSCNPAMPLSGFAMESKGDILDSFTPPTLSRIRIADYQRFTQKNAVQTIAHFAEKHGWPLVLKPDVGERGNGVAIVRNLEEAHHWMNRIGEGQALVQEYIPGLEVGIHWARLPERPTGIITSIARKLPQSLLGNGSDTIEQLLLKDPRARAMAKHFLQQFGLRLTEIPADGEKITLTELGTHCLGAIFEDARDWITPELSQTLDEVGLSYEGFHFGRYDIRVPNEESLRRGKGLVILELNGVTGEPAHIYQPNYPLRRGLKDLRKHYQLASQIGRELCEKGAPHSSWKELWTTIKEHKKEQGDS